MKKIAYIILAACATVLGATSCNDDFLERSKQGAVDEKSAFVTYETSYNYVLGLYNMFNGYTQFSGPAPVSGALGTSTRDIWSGILTNYDTGIGNVTNPYANQTVSIPTSDGTYTNPYVWIRMANLMLKHIDEPEATDAERLHLEALARFFRAYCHYTLMMTYGDVIYVDELLTETSEKLHAARDSRLYVADRIYKELIWCSQNIQDAVAEPNTVNSDVVKALLSRFALFEGTWRKYHATDESACAANDWITGTELLEECARVSLEVMENHPTLYYGNSPDTHPGKGWGEMWTTEDLAGVPGVLLYVKYVADYKMHRLGHFEHIGSASLEMPQCTVDLYLTEEGLPIHHRDVKTYDYTADGRYVESATPYDYADANIYRTLRKRDPRLTQMVMPPYHVFVGAGANDFTPDTSNGGKWTEYLRIFSSRGILNGATGVSTLPNPAAGYHFIDHHKALPSGNWGGNVLPNVPNVQTIGAYDNSVAAAGHQMIYGNKPFQRGRSGYFVWKHHACWDKQDQNNPREVSDKPVFKVEETMLNYAEAMWELGRFDQPVADLTINKLRDRAEMGRMEVSAIDASFDPDRDPSVDPVLWEIRRERLIELMGESFSFEDVRRWKKADWFVNKQHYGMYLDDAAASFGKAKPNTGGTGILNPTTRLEASAADLAAMGGAGHLYYYLDPLKAGKGWLEKYYLTPLPSDELLLNENLEQQELWK